MADIEKKIKFTLEFDPKTGELKNAEQMVGKLKETTDKSHGAFDKLGQKVSSLAIGAVLYSAMRSALEADDAFQQLKAGFDETFRSIFAVAQPVLAMISNGLRGLMELIQAVAKILQRGFKQDWGAALTEMGDAVMRAGEISQGHMKLTTEKQKDELKKRQDQLAQARDIEAQIRSEGFQQEMTNEELNLAEREGLLDQWHQNEAARIQAAGNAKKQAKELTNAQLLQLDARYGQMKKAMETKEFQETSKFLQARMTAMASAGAKELENSKNAQKMFQAMGAASIRDAANVASQAIVVYGAEAAAKALAKGGGIPWGLPMAVATMAFYSSLAAVVGGVGGMAASAVAPSGGGGVPAGEVSTIPETGEPAPLGGSLPGGIGGEAARSNANVIVINNNMLDGRNMDPAAAAYIANLVAREGAR